MMTAKLVASGSPKSWVQLSGWTDQNGNENYVVIDPYLRLEGPASIKDMSIVYTCQLSGCIVGCRPCNICRGAGTNCCKLRLNPELCKKCDSQCSAHQITVPYMFDPAFTIVTEKMEGYRFGYKYAGIPSSCVHCSKDLLEHQFLHLIDHKLCRFCRFETRPLGYNKHVLSLDDYKKKEEILKSRDDKTCSICLKESKDKTSREKHEAIVHRKETQRFKCDKCPKSYTSMGTLSYHFRTKHEEVEKQSCEDCGKQFTHPGTLLTHKKLIHTGWTVQLGQEYHSRG